MNVALRAAALAASLAVTAAMSGVEDGALKACKNHYILRCVPAAIEWTPTATPSLQYGPGASATLLEDGRVLLVGDSVSGRGAEIYDPATGRWLAAAPMNVVRTSHRAVRLRDGRVFVVGSDLVMPRGGDRANAEIYDPANDTWTPTPPLIVKRGTWTRGDLTANLLPDGSVLVTGGNDPGWNAHTETEIYDPSTGTWRMTGRLAMGRLSHTATTLADGSVLVLGGVTDWDFYFGVPTAELYEPASGAWRMLGPVLPRKDDTATLLADGKVLVTGGHPTLTSSTTGESFVYDPVRREMVSNAALARQRHGQVAIAIEGGVLVVGGWVSRMTGMSAVWGEGSALYDTDSQTWSAVDEIGVPAFEPFSATPIGERLVLIIGPLGAYLLSY